MPLLPFVSIITFFFIYGLGLGHDQVHAFDHLSRSHDAKGRWEEVEAENRDKQWGGCCYPGLGVLIMVRMD